MTAPLPDVITVDGQMCIDTTELMAWYFNSIGVPWYWVPKNESK